MDRTILQLEDTLSFLAPKVQTAPKIGLILGSGLGGLVEEIDSPQNVPYAEIPGFPVSTVEGHTGQLVFGSLRGQAVVAMQGRFHFYEGYAPEQLTFPVRVMQRLGVESLVVTNAAGGINKDFTPGDLVLISDHINLMGANPLLGVNIPEFGPRFPDMSQAYNPELRELAKTVAAEQGISLKEGVYCGLAGPSYETPAEIRFLRIIGADQVGMSTIPEVLVANHAGLKVLGISCITNMAAGILPQKLNHQEVMATAELIREKFKRLVSAIVKQM